MRRRTFFTVVLPVLLAGGLATAEEADLRAQVREAQEGYASAWTAGDVDGLSAFFADDVIYWPPTGGELRGREAVRGYLEQRPGSTTVAIETSHAERIGDLVLDVGTTTVTAAAGEATPYGYVVVAEQGPGGLRIKRFVGFPPRPPAGSPR